MDKIINLINQKISDTCENIKLTSVIYNSANNSALFVFIYQNFILDEQIKQQILDILNTQYDNKFKINTKFKKSFLDKDVIVEHIFSIINQKWNGINQNFKKQDIIIEINQKEILAKININSIHIDYMKNLNFEKSLKENCQDNFFGIFDVQLIAVNNENVDNILDEQSQILEQMIAKEYKKIETFQVDEITPIIGDEFNNKVSNICDVKGVNDDIEIAGVVEFLLKKSFVAKKKDAQGNDVVKEYLSFNLKREGSSINCVYFPTKNTIDLLDNIDNDMQLILRGSSEVFANRVNFKVKNIASCILPPEKVVEQQINNKIYDEYKYIQPEKYYIKEQTNLFFNQEQVSDYLKNNQFVVFDFETTGLDANNSEIIEIGAVKVVNGKIDETFGAFIKPKKLIPAEITKITSITNEMVKDGVSVDQMIPDFYKFSENCILVAHNIDFDYKFLNAASMKIGYKFTNKQLDTLYLSRKYVLGIKQFNLGAVCKKLDISLEGAHRAVNDAEACAKLFIELSKNLSD